MNTTNHLKLRFMCCETALARLYQDSQGRQQWIPRSVCVRVLKHPAQDGQMPLHEVDIESWWLDKNPFSAVKAAAQGELIR